LVAYTPEERLVGGSVNAQLKKNMTNSILFPSRFLGLNQACKEQIALEQRFTTNKFEPQPDGKLRWKVKSSGQAYELTIEQIVGFYLSRLRNFYETAGVNSKDVVISIPSYASNVERQALLDASEIAGFKCLRIINESTAICLNYGFFRKGDLDENQARTVAFVDFGHSKTTVTIASFVKAKCKILCHHSDRNLGGRDFDYQIAEKLGEEFSKKYGSNPIKNDKARIRLLEGAEKARTLLSGVPDASINLEYLYEEQDLNRNLNREEFQTLCDPQLRRFHKLLEETIELSGLTADQI
jgi:heat shock protein 4